MQTNEYARYKRLVQQIIVFFALEQFVVLFLQSEMIDNLGTVY